MCKEIVRKFGFVLMFFAISFFSGENGQLAGSFIPDTDNIAVEQAFRATLAELQEFYISGWVQVSGEKLKNADLDSLAKGTLSGLMDVSNTVEYESKENAYQSQVQISSQNAQQHITVIAQAIYAGGKRDFPAETYLTINILSKSGDCKIKALEGQVKEILSQNGDQFAITTCLSGWVNGKLKEEKMARLVRAAFRQVDASVVEGIEMSQFISYAGLTDKIDNSVRIGQNNINLNIAMRYNDRDDRTYVTVATPIITQEY